MAKFTDTKDYIFTKLCDTFVRFEIPNFQRAYAWKNKEIQEFWDSLTSNDKNYFMGNIVAIKPEESDESPITIVDGQQRLTTIFLFLAALRDTYSSLKEKIGNQEHDEDRKKIEEDIALIDYRIFYIDPFENKHVRLSLGTESYQRIFDAIMYSNKTEMESTTLDKQQSRYITNYKIATKYINNYIQHSELSKLSELKAKLLSLQFVTIVLESDAEIYNIFEGFNSTGLGLSPADLIKNAILKGTCKEIKEQEEAEFYWRDMEELFEITDPGRITRYLRYYWMMHKGYISSGNLFKEVKDQEIKGKTSQEIKKYIVSLNEHAKVYLGLLYEKCSKELTISKNLMDAFKKFRYIRNEQVYVVLLSIYYKIGKIKSIQEKEWLEILQNLWLFVVRARYSNISPSGYERTFASMSLYINETEDKKNLVEKLHKDFVELFSKVNSNDDFVKYFVQDASYNSDSQLMNQAIKDIMYQENTEIQLSSEIEHIVPQNPEKWGLTAIDIEDYVHTIGNLTLLTTKDNQVNCKDNPFDIKAKVYEKSLFKINNEIVSKYGDLFRKDYKQAIVRRGEDIARKIAELWQYNELIKTKKP